MYGIIINFEEKNNKDVEIIKNGIKNYFTEGRLCYINIQYFSDAICLDIGNVAG